MDRIPKGPGDEALEGGGALGEEKAGPFMMDSVSYKVETEIKIINKVVECRSVVFPEQHWS